MNLTERIKVIVLADATRNSYFDGNAFQRIGWQILVFLLSVISLGIAYPWAMCMMERWKTKHTVITGRRLKFTGHGHQLFGKYILWAFLTLITLGIYSIWFGLGMKKWVVKHTVYADGSSGVESRFTGGAGGWFGYHLLFGLIAVVTLGIGVPWGQKMLLCWEAEHTEIDGSALVFSGTGGQLLVKYLIFVLLTPLTLGIYAIFFPVSVLKWQISHTARRNGVGTPVPAPRPVTRQVPRTAQGKSPAPAKGVSKGPVIAAVVVLAVVVLGGIGVILAWAAPSIKTSEPEPENLSAEEFRHILTGDWSNARWDGGWILTVYYTFYAGGEFELGSGAYDNIHLNYFPDVEVDEYGWYSVPMGHPSFYGNYSLTASGDNHFTLTVIGAVEFAPDDLSQSTSELVYVDDNTILIDGETYVRGGHTLAEYAEIFGFAIEVEDAGDQTVG